MLPTTESVDPKLIGIGTVYEWVTPHRRDGWHTTDRDARIVHCPAADHLDNSPSAKIHLTQHVWHCYSCGAGGGILDMIVAANVVDAKYAGNPRMGARRWLEEQVGIEHVRPLRAHAKPKPHQLRGKKLTNEEQTASFFYTDADGTVVYRVVRIEGLDDDGKPAKRFEAHALRNGKWLRGMFGTAPLPYHLPDLVAARESGETVTWLEGERDADLVDSLGYLSTSTPFGAAFVVRPDWHQYFAGLHVLLIGDGDFAGRRAVERRAKAIEPVAASVRIHDPWPDHIDDGYDTTDLVRDLFADGHDETTMALEVGLRLNIIQPPAPLLKPARPIVVAA